MHVHVIIKNVFSMAQRYISKFDSQKITETTETLNCLTFKLQQKCIRDRRSDALVG